MSSWFRNLLLAALLLPLVGALAVYAILRGSLAQLDGELEVGGLIAPLSIERDQLGVVTIDAANRRDAAFAAGFVHAQERLFQMDLQRRASAGELAALLGPVAVDFDRQRRLHGFRRRARAMVLRLSPQVAELYRAYADGVNTGVAALAAWPFEYWLLQSRPEPWLPEDTLLTVFNMWFELNDETARRESQLALLRDHLPAAVYDWLVQSGTDWDAPLLGGPVPPVPMPAPGDYDLRNSERAVAGPARGRVGPSAPQPGSNNWAVAGSRTADGAAILAGDMHLGLAVPNIWFRARIRIAAEDLDLNGVMLSGTPFVVAGSNGHIAWSYTNSYGDWEDLVVVESDASDQRRYRTPQGWLRLDARSETIEVRGGAPVTLDFDDTIWGPLLDVAADGERRALHWLAHNEHATNSELIRLETARNVDDAIAIANRIGAPPQNFVVADRFGRIGWTIMGRIPRRGDDDPLYPESWADSGGWQGFVVPADYPRITDPAEGILWTANARTVDGAWLELIGEGNYAAGARAGQIRDRLRDSSGLTIGDMLDIQLDDRALFLSRWRQLLLDTLGETALSGHPERAALRRQVQQWQARASVDSVGYRLVRAFRDTTIDAALTPLLAPVLEHDPQFRLLSHGQLERPVWEWLQRRPPHLLDPRYSGYEEFLLRQVDEVINYFAGFDGPLSGRTWGERNASRINHPLSRGLPWLAQWLDMPVRPLPGDEHMPRVQGPDFGASQRMAVSPGQEQHGYLHMPGGQSGHPLSPFYGAGHEDWAEGRPGSFLPGPARHRLTLRPE